MATLTLNNINKSFDGNPVLKEISLSLNQGEVLGIWGKNASAKTTLANIIYGNTQPDSGTITIENQNRSIKNPTIAKSMGIAMIREDILLFENMTVAENIFMGNYKKLPGNKILSSLGIINKKVINEKAKELFEQYQFQINVTSKVRKLGMAEKQIVNIFHALVKQAKILIMDEPFSNLDLNDIQKIFKIIKSIQASGVSVIFLSQNFKQLSEISTSIIVLENGQITKQLKNDDRQSYPKLYDNIIEYPFPKLSTPKYDVFYECKNICYKDIIKDVSFKIYQGEVLGILGASNSGRSTLARLICGDLKTDIGKTYIHNKPVKISSPLIAHQHKIAFITENTLTYGLIPYSNLEANISLNNYKRSNNKIIKFIINNKKLAKETLNIADKFGINYQNKQKLPVRKLSSGHQKKIAFARSVYAGAQFYLLDEPTKGIDNTGRIAIYNIINELSREGKCVLFFTSDMEEAVGMCDRTLILRSGQIVGEFERNEYSQEKVFNNIYN